MRGQRSQWQLSQFEPICQYDSVLHWIRRHHRLLSERVHVRTRTAKSVLFSQFYMLTRTPSDDGMEECNTSQGRAMVSRVVTQSPAVELDGTIIGTHHRAEFTWNSDNRPDDILNTIPLGPPFGIGDVPNVDKSKVGRLCGRQRHVGMSSAHPRSSHVRPEIHFRYWRSIRVS
jgi:hypothetical protein